MTRRPAQTPASVWPVTAKAAGAFRRTPIERADQRVSWERDDQAFFGTGACHILAWACRESDPDRGIELGAVRSPGKAQVFHTFAVWNGWAFDHSGWNPEQELLAENAAFEGRALERVAVTTDLAEFCQEHWHRMPDQYWRDPRPRAREYVARHTPPWL